MQIKTSVTDVERDPLTVDYDFGDDLAGTIEKFGEEIVYNKAVAAMRVDLQGFIRGKMRATNEEDGSFSFNDSSILEAVEEWRPGLRKPAKSNAEKMAELLASMTEDEKADFLSSIE